MAHLTEVFRPDDHPPLKRRQYALMIDDQFLVRILFFILEYAFDYDNIISSTSLGKYCNCSILC